MSVIVGTGWAAWEVGYLNGLCESMNNGRTQYTVERFAADDGSPMAALAPADGNVAPLTVARVAGVYIVLSETGELIGKSDFLGSLLWSIVHGGCGACESEARKVANLQWGDK